MSTTRGLTSFSIIMPLVLTVRRLPYTVLGSFASLLLVPRSLEETAASVGGAMGGRSFRDVTLPLIWKGVLDQPSGRDADGRRPRLAARPGGAARAGFIARELRQVAHVLGDEGAQEALRRIWLSATLETLRPRRPGELPPLPGEGQAPAGLFSGTFTGKWLDVRGTDLDVKMVLVRQADTVNGSYTLFTVDSAGRRHTHGSSALTLVGTVREGTLEYEWKWGTDYFGRGRLRAQEGGRVLTGTWGYTRAAEGAGTWQLRRVER